MLPITTDPNQNFDLLTLSGLTEDSRKVKKGYLFAAFKGSHTDGAEYIPQALKAGAAIILCDKNVDIADFKENYPNTIFMQDDNPRKVFAEMVAGFYGQQPQTICAVTGTNGKTSVASFVRQLWEHLDYANASLGTIGLESSENLDDLKAVSMTTPDTVRLHETLKALKEKDVDHLAMEASSHGLDQHRLHGVEVSAAGFTNLTHDHLDYHGTMEAYFEAKAKLFKEVLDEEGTAVINIDDPYGQKLYDDLKSNTHIQCIDYGSRAQAVRFDNLKPHAKGQSFDLTILDQSFAVSVPLVGAFQVMNLICALGLVIAEHENDKALLQKLIAALPNIKSVPGRLEFVQGHSENAGVYVDYAHTPDALLNVLKALKAHQGDGRLMCVFGCGGDRDKGKRPEMGRVAAELSDIPIVTDDNPRGENPAQIRSEILKTCPGALEIGDRAKAIRHAIQNAKDGDIVLIAGKGHEQGQIVGDQVLPFNDVQQAQIEIQTFKEMKEKTS